MRELRSELSIGCLIPEIDKWILGPHLVPESGSSKQPGASEFSKLQVFKVMCFGFRVNLGFGGCDITISLFPFFR